MKQCRAIATTERLTRATTPQHSFCLDAIPFLATRTKVATIKQKKVIRISWSGDIVDSVKFAFQRNAAGRQAAGVCRDSGENFGSATQSLEYTENIVPKKLNVFLGLSVAQIPLTLLPSIPNKLRGNFLIRSQVRIGL